MTETIGSREIREVSTTQILDFLNLYGIGRLIYLGHAEDDKDYSQNPQFLFLEKGVDMETARKVAENQKKGIEYLKEVRPRKPLDEREEIGYFTQEGETINWDEPKDYSWDLVAGSYFWFRRKQSEGNINDDSVSTIIVSAGSQKKLYLDPEFMNNDPLLPTIAYDAIYYASQKNLTLKFID